MPHESALASSSSAGLPDDAAAEPPEAQAARAPIAARADLLKRFAAALIDAALAGIVSLVPLVGGLLGATYFLVRDGLDLEFMDRRSLGKKLLALRVVRRDGRPMDVVASVKRNLTLAVGLLVLAVPLLGWLLGPFFFLFFAMLEGLLVLADEQGRRLGDRLADTVVIDDEPELPNAS